jgi:hypothetical protein
LRVSSTGAQTITGLAAPASGGRLLLLINVGASTITLAHQSASSVAGNRFLFEGGANLALPASASAFLWYDTTSDRWRGGTLPGGGAGAFTSVATAIVTCTEGAVSVRTHARSADSVGMIGTTTAHDFEIWRNSVIRAKAVADGFAVLERLKITPAAGDAASPADGDMWTNSTTDRFRGRENGVTRNLIRDITTGAFASAPSTHDAGDLYQCNDAPALLRSNGSTWDVLGPVWKFTPVVPGDFSWINQGSNATEVALGPHRVLSAPDGGDHLRVKNAPSVPYTITMACLHAGMPTGGVEFGLAFHSTSDSKSSTIRIADASAAASTNPLIRLIAASTHSSFAAAGNYVFFPWAISGLIWLRIRRTSTNRYYEFSSDGTNFITLASSTATDHHDPDKVGYYVKGNGGSNVSTLTVLSWVES